MSALRFVLVAAFLACTACTRTPDGSLVPAYQTRVVVKRGLPRVDVQRTKIQQPRHETESFPPVPPLVRDEPAARHPRKARPSQRSPEKSIELRCGPADAVAARYRMNCS
jgi:hypothetical protein